MKQITKSLLAISCMAFLGTTLVACQKGQQMPSTEMQSKPDHISQLKKSLADIMQIPLDSVTFDEAKKEFVALDRYNFPLLDVQKLNDNSKEIVGGSSK